MAHHARTLIAAAALLTLSPGCGPGAGAPVTGATQSLVLEPRPVEIVLGFTGRISPGDRADLLAPYEGVIETLHVHVGDRVAAGDALVTLNPADLQRERAQAEAALLRAEADAAELEDWENGPEMSRARRDVAGARADLSDLERRLEETAALLERGLVPRGEYDGLVQQRRDLGMQLDQALEQLEATRERGTGNQRRIALLERDLARERLERIEAELANSTLRAPVAGLVVRPPDADGELGEPLRAGSRVSRGRPLLIIARPDALDVSFRLNEGDVTALLPGAPVRVTGPGFPGVELTGTLTAVAGQAEASAAGQLAEFTATARLDPLPDSAAGSVRIGMTADIDVVVFADDAALLVPAQAVEGAPGDAWVHVRDAPGAPPRRVQVDIRATGPAGVVLGEGVAPGDTIVWQN